ncbi:hypothetical protein [Stenotrophomonas sp. Iso1]|uniref:hypothetical protein n=1 Tax=Stenotrophomonas sp. Iso1 TaxID=2977283 RepID=UPI0022B78187|nr:hypothetical protein [Stenotrophomonas sp. Iso1]
MPVYLPWLMTAGFGWLYYRRIRRHFGWQPWRPVRNSVRIVLLSVLGLLLAWGATYMRHAAPGMMIGAVTGIALGVFGLKYTRISPRDGRPGYTPNPWIGGVLSIVLVGRLAWRWYNGAFSQGMMQGGGSVSPLTMGLVAALLSYGLVQAVGLSLRLRRAVV